MPTAMTPRCSAWPPLSLAGAIGGAFGGAHLGMSRADRGPFVSVRGRQCSNLQHVTPFDVIDDPRLNALYAHAQFVSLHETTRFWLRCDSASGWRAIGLEAPMGVTTGSATGLTIGIGVPGQFGCNQDQYQPRAVQRLESDTERL